MFRKKSFLDELFLHFSAKVQNLAVFFIYLHDSNSIFWARRINSEWVFGRTVFDDLMELLILLVRHCSHHRTLFHISHQRRLLCLSLPQTFCAPSRSHALQAKTPIIIPSASVEFNFCVSSSITSTKTFCRFLAKYITICSMTTLSLDVQGYTA